MTLSAVNNATTSKDVDVLQPVQTGTVDRADDDAILDNDEEEDSSARLLGPKNKSPSPNAVRGASFVEGESEAPSLAISALKKSDEKAAVGWMDLPKKGQLAILTLARLSEPLTQTSLTAYMFYQLKSFDPSLPESAIAAQAGMLQASFPAAQFLTAVLWGQAADTEWIGRKRVLLIGLLGTCFACLGFGFSKTFVQAMVFRVVGGAVNGNIGVMRTMISEIIEEKKYQSRAFLLLPMCFNIGVIVGPILGGFLADPITSFPGIFGPDSLMGGKTGVSWMQKWPYALPNLVSTVFIFISATGVILGLDETHHIMRYKPDYGRKVGNYLLRTVFQRRPSHHYTRLDQTSDTYSTSISLESQPNTTSHSYSSSNPLHNPTPDSNHPKTFEKLPFRKIWTSNVLLTVSAHFFLAVHISSFNATFPVFLPAPRSPDDNAGASLPFRFNGGLGLSSQKVGLACAVIGIIGLPLQLLLYPHLNSRLGTLRCYRLFLPFSPLAYTLMPFLALLPNNPFLVWPCLIIVLGLQVLARTFTLPGAIILINNSSPHPSVLGTLHGVAQSVSSGARTLGPVLAGWGLGLGLHHNIVGAVWWAIAGVAVVNYGMLWLLKDSDE